MNTPQHYNGELTVAFGRKTLKERFCEKDRTRTYDPAIKDGTLPTELLPLPQTFLRVVQSGVCPIGQYF